MTDKEILDQLKQIQNEGAEALRKENREMAEKAFAEYDKKFDQYAADINNRLSETEAALKTRDVVDGRPVKDAAVTAVLDFARTGRINDIIQTGSDPDGGVTVPKTMSDRIIEYAADGNPLRDLAETVTISTGSYEMLDEYDEFEADWISELTPRSVTENAKLGKIQIFPHEMNAIPKATRAILEDSAFDIEGWINRGIAKAFAKKENAAFFNGDGVEKATGILFIPKVDDSDWERGKVGFINSGAASGLKADAVIALQDALDDEYSANATWLMHKSTFTALRQLKSGTGGQDRYLLWTPEIVGGRLENMLMGSPVRKCSAMPKVDADAFPIAYGDFRQAYTIVDRIGMTMLRNPYLMPGFVLFDTRKRVGGGVTNSQAYKLLKIAA